MTSITDRLRAPDYAVGALFLVGAAITLYGVSLGLDRVPVHFDGGGTPDRYMAPVPGLILLPVAAVGTYLLVKLLPRLDPLAANLRQFQSAYEWFGALLVGVFVLTQAYVVARAAGTTLDVLWLVGPTVAAVYLGIGRLLRRAERNWFIGIRTPWTLSSDRVWRRTHDRVAWLFGLSALPAVAAAIVPEYATVLLIGPAAATALYATAYSYLLYRREEPTDRGGDGGEGGTRSSP